MLVIVLIVLSYVYQSSSFFTNIPTSSLSLRTSSLSLRTSSSSLSRTCHSNKLNHGRFFNLRIPSSLLATMERVSLSGDSSSISVGDSLTAQVNDVKGSISDPIVEFTIKKGGGLKATMPTKTLSMNERLALTTGAIMQGIIITIITTTTLIITIKSM
jgi:hypothetical protein